MFCYLLKTKTPRISIFVVVLWKCFIVYTVKPSYRRIRHHSRCQTLLHSGPNFVQLDHDFGWITHSSDEDTNRRAIVRQERSRSVVGLEQYHWSCSVLTQSGRSALAASSLLQSSHTSPTNTQLGTSRKYSPGWLYTSLLRRLLELCDWRNVPFAQWWSYKLRGRLYASVCKRLLLLLTMPRSVDPSP